MDLVASKCLEMEINAQKQHSENIETAYFYCEKKTEFPHMVGRISYSVHDAKGCTAE